jgi:hypothetical protein
MKKAGTHQELISHKCTADSQVLSRTKDTVVDVDAGRL